MHIGGMASGSGLFNIGLTVEVFIGLDRPEKHKLTHFGDQPGNIDRVHQVTGPLSAFPVFTFCASMIVRH
ncbi:hypothetical protein [Oceanimonas doudoroffii]|uniref:Uncharacterized protein n=1 Tax=Oceanimonas doudoroffii TaxID=84158 RepID=A0A233RJ82_9GAMM|nr:hypothetical protein [Oceanimonas doudoroffii]OXY83457.1 hypothetical protein B6S08_08225 [Oceanimonas doudoroffii]